MRTLLTAACLLGCCVAQPVPAQESIALPEAAAVNQPVAQPFSFASDGPIGPGWTRPDQIARVYVHEDLPALFRRTLRLDDAVPERCTLSWIFTGPRAGVTVELGAGRVRMTEREYSTVGLREPGAGERILHQSERTFTGRARTLTVVVDAHLSVRVLVNGLPVLTDPIVFDLSRQQLMFTGPRNEHRVLSGALLQEPVGNTTVHVDPAAQHQAMLGFGGSPSVPAYAGLSDEGKRQYWALLQRYNLRIDREYPMGTELRPDLSNFEALHDATPHYYGDNFPNGEVSDFEYSRRTRAMGGSVLYEMWALPAWAQQPYSPKEGRVIDAWGKAVHTAPKLDEYTRIVVEFCRQAKAKSGAAPEIVGIQNEVEQAPEIYAAMTTAVRKALDNAGFRSTRIQMADAPYAWMATGRMRDLQRFPDAWRDTDYTAAHQYDYQEFIRDPDGYDQRLMALHAASGGKVFLATEICLNDGQLQEPSYRLALQVGQLYQKDLVEVDAAMLLYCWLILDVEQPNFGGSRSLLVPDRTRGQVPVASSFQLRVLGAFSRHVLAGMRRVEATSPNNDLLTAAFADGAHRSLILLNRSTGPIAVTTDWQGTRWTHVERTSFSQENAESAAPAQIEVQPGEIVTLSTFAGAR